MVSSDLVVELAQSALKENKKNIQYTSEELSHKLYGLDFSEIEEFGNTIFRKYVLNLPNSNIKEIINNTLENRSLRSVKIKQK